VVTGVRFREIDLEGVTVVARGMRACDRAEIFATRWSDCTDAFAQDCVACLSLGAVIADEAEMPIAVIGAQETWPGVWSVCMFATDRWPEIALDTTRFARERLMPALVRHGARRAECRSAADHHAAHRWLEYLGARHESTHPEYGKHGETFLGYSWRIDDVRKSLLTAESPYPETAAVAAEGR
jgi:hypothetical protein